MIIFWYIIYLRLLFFLCITGIIFIIRERSRQKPVDEEEAKLGRWVASRIKIWYLICKCILRDTLFLWIYFYIQSIHRISFILLQYIYTLHCALASLALLYRVIETLHPSSNFRSHISERFFLTSLVGELEHLLLVPSDNSIRFSSPEV